MIMTAVRALLWVHCRCVSDFDAPVSRDGPPGIAIVMSGPPVALCMRVCGRFGTGGSSVATNDGDTLVPVRGDQPRVSIYNNEITYKNRKHENVTK